MGLTDPYYHDEFVTIYHGDCFDLLPWLSYDLIITDPPYGINVDNAGMPNATDYGHIAGDESMAVAERFMPLIADTPAAVFGANYFPHALPHRGRWVCWDKRLSESADRILGSPFELAWVNDRHRHQTEMIRTLHAGSVNANGAGRARTHPTEKAVPMLHRLIEFVAAAGVILDPFAGSGTTLRAAKDLGRRSIGIELEERYCEAAANRLAQEVLRFG